ncbi:MAG: Ig-like domain-containing protein [Leadbetterella sp.]
MRTCSFFTSALNFKVLLNAILIASFICFCAKAQTDVTSNYTFKPVVMGGAGWVTGLVFHPTAQNVVYCRTDVGGAYKWDQANGRWINLSTVSRMPELLNISDGNYGPGGRRDAFYEVESIGLDPQNSEVIYIAMGNLYDSQGGVMMKSTNGGSTFSLLKNLPFVQMAGNFTARFNGERIVVNPSNSNKILFGTRQDGLKVSEDGGATWTTNTNLPAGTPVNEDGLPGNDIVGINVLVYENSTRVYASVSGFGLYKSEDGGTNWTQILSNSASELRVAAGKLVAVVKKGGVRTYDPATGSWSAEGLPSTNIVDIAIKPNEPNVIYAINDGTNNIYRTVDGGLNWSNTNTNNNDGKNNFKASLFPWKENTDLRNWLSVGEIEFNPNNSNDLWYAEGMGTFRTTSIGNTTDPVFEDNSTGIEELVALGITAAPGGKVNVVGMDRMGFNYTNPDVAPNLQMGLGQNFTSGWSVIASPTDPNFLSVAVTDHRDWGGAGVSGYSTDGGLTWTNFGSVPQNGMYGEIAVGAGNNSNNLVWKSRNGTGKTYYSKDKGLNWSEASIPDYLDDENWWAGAKRVLSADGLTPEKFYIISNGTSKIYSTLNGGTSWNIVGSTPFSGQRTQKLRCTPGIANHLWLVSGYNSEFTNPREAAGIYFSNSGGESFAKLPGFDECWSIGFGKKQTPSSYPTIFVYGRYNGNWGLYRSTDQGSTWSKCAEYIQGRFNSVNDISGDPDVFGKVYVATGSTGFAYGVSNEVNTIVDVASVSISPASITLNPGNTQALSPTVLPSNATNKAVTYVSSNPTVATVNTTGLVTALSQGNTTITVTTADGGKTTTSAITVTSVSGGGIGVILFDDALASGWSATSWEATANVNNTSTVYAGSKSLEINYTSAWGGVTLEKTTSQAVENFDKIKVWANGGVGNKALQFIVFDENNVEKGREQFVIQGGAWNEYTILLSEVGSPISIKKILIQDGSGAPTTSFYLDNLQFFGVPVNSVVLTPQSSAIPIGTTIQLSASVSPTNSSNKKITFSSSNTAVATVNSTGLVSGVSAGAVVITATSDDGNKTATTTITVNGSSSGSQMIYDDALASDWTMSFWGTEVNLSNTTTVQSGQKAIAMNFSSAWGALTVVKGTPQSTSGFDKLKLWIHGGNGNKAIQVVVFSGDNNESGRKQLTAIGGAWNEYTVLLSEVGSPETIKSFFIHDGSGAQTTEFYVDKISLENGSTTSTVNNLTPEYQLIYPNPSEGRFTLNYEDKQEEKVSFQIRNMQGRTLFTTSQRSKIGKNSKDFDVKLLPGVYTINVFKENKTSQLRLVIGEK